MVDMAAIAAGLSSLRAAGDITRNLIEVRDLAKFQGELIELQRQIISAQQSAITVQADQVLLLEQIRDLKITLKKFENWDAEKKRYKLLDFGGGTFAYALRVEASNGDPSHNQTAPREIKNPFFSSISPLRTENNFTTARIAK